MGSCLSWSRTIAGLFCGLALLFLAAQTTAAQSEAIDRGVAYLIASQNADGSWSSGDKQIVDTVEAFKTLAELSADSNSLTKRGARCC